jgi:hypothetical protein
MTTSPRTIHVIGAKGGQGTSTVAALIALEAQDAGSRVTLVSADGNQGDLRALLGLAASAGNEHAAEAINFVNSADGPAVTVIDHGTSTADGRLTDGGAIYLVVRGPCYLGLRRALALGVRPDGVILLSESGRSLGRSDLEDVLGVKVVAEVEVSPQMARCLDAGIVSATRRRPRLNLKSTMPV